MKKYSKLMAILLVFTMILAGVAQAAPVVKAEEVNSNVIRLSGADRIKTSVKISQTAYKDGAESVVIVGYEGEVDALAGTLLAHAKKGPVLFTKKGKLSEDTKTEIARLGAKNVYILGGTATIEDAVKTELETLKYTVKRISGSNREGTAAAVAKEVGGKTTHVFLARGYGDLRAVLSDALAVGPASAKGNMAVLLTRTDKVPAATLKSMKDLGVTNVTIVGGEVAVNSGVKTELETLKYTVDRLSGTTREGTAIAIANKYFAGKANALVANGYGSPDALVGGYLGAAIDAPILFSQANKVSEVTTDYLKANTEKAWILGGEGVVNKEVLNKVLGAVVPTPTPPSTGGGSGVQVAIGNVINLTKNKGYKTMQEAITDAESGDTLKLIADISTHEGITVDKNITFDLNEKTITNSLDANEEGNENAIAIVVKSKATIKNGTIITNNGTGGIQADGTSANLTIDGLTINQNGLNTKKIYNSTAVLAANDAKITINSGYYSAETDAVLVKANGGTVIIKDGTFTAGRSAARNDAWGEPTHSLTINGGTFNAEKEKDSYALFSAGGNAATTVNGGIFNGEINSEYNHMIINDGTFNQTIFQGGGHQDFYIIYGGTFVDDLSGTLPKNTRLIRAINTTNDKGYETIQEAIDEAEDEDTIQIAAGTYDESIVVPEEKVRSITILGANSDTIPTSSEVDGTIITGGIYIGTDSGAEIDKNVTVKGITFNGGKGLLLGNIKTATVENNKFLHIKQTFNPSTTDIAAIAVIDPYAGGNTTINNNYIDGVQGVGEGETGQGLGIYIRKPINVSISGNHVEGTAHNTILLAGTVTGANVSITGNKLVNWDSDNDDDGGRAIRISFDPVDASTALTVTGNTFTPNDDTDRVDDEYVKITGVHTDAVGNLITQLADENIWTDNPDFATVILVNSTNWGPASITRSGVTTYYASIGAAITAATAGDTIEVAAGTYNEALSIDKDLTLQGAAGVTLTGGTMITAGDVTIEGFTISNKGILASGITGLTLEKNTFNEIRTAMDGSPGGSVIGLDVTSASGPIVINNNEFSGIGENKGTGTAIRMVSLSGKTTITNNEIKDVTKNGINLYNYSSAVDLTITGNTISNWDSDKDENKGGRAIRIEFNSKTGSATINNNTLTLPEYAADFTPVDPEYVKITGSTNITKDFDWGSVELEKIVVE